MVMSIYYLYSIIIVFIIIILIIRFFVLKNHKIPEKIFVEALRNENSGDFEAAIISYEIALQIVKKAKHHNYSLENKILEKIKVLHTVIEYKYNLQFTR
jgi:hypothetical protein